tara:strand:- start:52 stop:363 length:312 start_codon:yes stop_codon:yes gene_type:complete
VRIFTGRIEDNNLISDSKHLTLDLDPDNEFIWNASVLEKVQNRFKDLISTNAGEELTDYSLRKIGSDLEGMIRELLQSGELSYNPECRVLNYSMGLPRTPDLL